ALHPMHAALELEAAERALPLDRGDHLLETAEPRPTRAEHVDPPAPRLRVAAVHAEELRREEARLLAAGAGADLEQHVALVVGVARQEELLQPCLEIGVARTQAGQLLLRERAHRLVGVLQQALAVLDLPLHVLPLTEGADDLLEAGALLREL